MKKKTTTNQQQPRHTFETLEQQQRQQREGISSKKALMQSDTTPSTLLPPLFCTRLPGQGVLPHTPPKKTPVSLCSQFAPAHPFLRPPRKQQPGQQQSRSRATPPHTTSSPTRKRCSFRQSVFDRVVCDRNFPSFFYRAFSSFFAERETGQRGVAAPKGSALRPPCPFPLGKGQKRRE